MRKLTWTVAVLATAVAALVGPTATAAKRVQCRADGPMPAQVHESQFDSNHGPARLFARLSGTGTISCSNRLTSAPLQIEQSLELIEQYGGGNCFKSADISTMGQVRGRSELTLAIRPPDGETRRLNLRGSLDGTSRVDDQNPTRCLLNLDVSAHFIDPHDHYWQSASAQTADSGRLSLQLTAVVDRASGELISALMSSAEVDTW